MFSPPIAAPENFKDILEKLDETDENTYENGFQLYDDLYKLINMCGLPGTGYFFPCIPLPPTISVNYYVTIDNPEHKVVMNEINILFYPTSPQNSLHENDNDNQKAPIPHIQMND